MNPPKIRCDCDNARIWTPDPDPHHDSVIYGVDVQAEGFKTIHDCPDIKVMHSGLRRIFIIKHAPPQSTL